MAEEKKGFKFPSAYTILFILIILVAVATWIVPAGQYELNEAGEPIPGSYHPVESNPQRIIADGLMAIVNLAAILLLSPVAIRVMRDYTDQLSRGEEPVFDRKKFPDIEKQLEDDVW